MNQITLYRKGGRKPWVFEWSKLARVYRYHSLNKNFIYDINFTKDWMSGSPDGVHISRLKLFKNGASISDGRMEKEIKADHFKLGNVTITF